MMRLEPRSLAAPFFARGNNFTGGLLSGGRSQVFNLDSQYFGDYGNGGGPFIDDTYAASIADSAQASAGDELGGGQWSASEKGSITASISGPGSGNPGDPNPLTTPQIEINVQHTGQDWVVSTVPGPFNSGGGIYESTSTNTYNPNTQQSNLDYVVVGGEGNSTLTITFKASLGASGDPFKFQVNALLSLQSTFMNVSINRGGLSVTAANGNQLLWDPNFEANAVLGSNDSVTLVVGNVGNFVNFDVSYQSSLTTTVMDNIPNGSFSNSTNFNWSLTAQIS